MDSLDVEEFNEILVRLGLYYYPGCVALAARYDGRCHSFRSPTSHRTFDLSSAPGIVAAVEALFLHLGSTDAAIDAGHVIVGSKNRK